MTTYKGECNQISWGTPEREYIIGTDPAFADSSPWVMVEYLEDGSFRIMNTPPILEGFERVLGRKFGHGDCNWEGTWRCGQFPHLCNGFKLCDDTKAEIKLKDKEIEETKIDTHPRHRITVRYGPNLFRDWKLIL